MRSSPQDSKHILLGAIAVVIVLVIGFLSDKAHALPSDKEAAIQPVESELQKLPIRSQFFTRKELLELRRLGEPIVRTKRWQADSETLFAPIYRARTGSFVIRYYFQRGQPAKLRDVALVIN